MLVFANCVGVCVRVCKGNFGCGVWVGFLCSVLVCVCVVCVCVGVCVLVFVCVWCSSIV